MHCKLAWGNVRRAGRDYSVYLLTLTLAVSVFYAFNTISVQVDFVSMEEGLSQLFGGIFSGLTVFLAAVMGFLMVYANGFIMKRRKKEFGLYQVLGMSRGQVARVMALETAIVSGVALVLGVLLGIGVSQLMTFFTASIFKTQIANFHFFFSMQAFALTVGCLFVIFLVTLAFNLLAVGRTSIIDLMSAGRKNEAIKTRSPMLSAVVFVLGVALIGVAYYRLLRDGLPVDAPADEMDAAMAQFSLTTGIVVAGTMLFFFGLSGFLLRMLQSAKGLYWRGLNMFTLRQLSAKVNTVGFSMAMISLILFLAITSVTGGMSIANVMNTGVEHNNPADYSRIVIYYGEETLRNSYDSGRPMGIAEEPFDIVELSKGDHVNPGLADEEAFDLDGILGKRVQVECYDSTPRGGSGPLITLNQLCEAVDMPLPVGTGSANTNVMGLQVMKESDYNRYRAFRELGEVDLGTDGYLLTSDMGETVNKVYDAAMLEDVAILLGDVTLHPRAQEVDKGASTFANSNMGSNSGTIIVPDAVVEKANLSLYSSYLLGDYRDDLTYEETEGYVRTDRGWTPNLCDANGREVGLWGMEVTRIQSYENTNTMNGLISYLAIYIGFVLVVACAAILTIQQLSSVADSGKNYRILSELGTFRDEIVRSMLVQQAVFFVFPLIMGVAHSMVALHVVIEIVALFGGISIGMTVAGTCAIFLLCYGGYFMVTYFMSKGIVSDAIRVRHAH